MVSILEPLREPHRTHSSTKQHSKVLSRVLGQARILLCDVGRFFENAPLGRKQLNRLKLAKTLGRKLYLISTYAARNPCPPPNLR